MQERWDTVNAEQLSQTRNVGVKIDQAAFLILDFDFERFFLGTGIVINSLCKLF